MFDHAEVVVVTNGDEAFAEARGRLRPDQSMIDLVGIDAHLEGDDYQELCW